MHLQIAPLEQFRFFRERPVEQPDQLQLLTAPTPNGVKVSIMLEEIGIPYQAHRIDISRGDTRKPEFLALNPNGKLPVIVDPHIEGNNPLVLWESGAILIYLAEKSGLLLPSTVQARSETIQWVMCQMSSFGPILGQLEWFHCFGGREIEDPRPRVRYAKEARRLLALLDKQLSCRKWIMDDTYTIADIAMLGWIEYVGRIQELRLVLELEEHFNVLAWLARGLDRTAVQAGLLVGRA